MPGQTSALHRHLKSLPRQSIPIAEDAGCPILHYREHSNDTGNLLLYFERKLDQTNAYAAVKERHMRRLYRMAILDLVEAFERFLKEIAAVCVDEVATAILDDRLEVFSVSGPAVAAHFQEQSIGRALCESSTWLSCEDITRRFRRLLSPPYDSQKGSFYLFPNATQQPAALRGKSELVALLFQIRHSIVHNAGVITESDAVKFSRLTQQRVSGSKYFWPDRCDVRRVKSFLDELVEIINVEVSKELAELLTTVQADDSPVFEPATKCQQLADLFQTQVQVASNCASPN